jgi:hypothetical protein
MTQKWISTDFTKFLYRQEPFAALIEAARCAGDRPCTCASLRNPARDVVKICMPCAARMVMDRILSGGSDNERQCNSVAGRYR